MHTILTDCKRSCTHTHTSGQNLVMEYFRIRCIIGVHSVISNQYNSAHTGFTPLNSVLLLLTYASASEIRLRPTIALLSLQHPMLVIYENWLSDYMVHWSS